MPAPAAMVLSGTSARLSGQTYRMSNSVGPTQSLARGSRSTRLVCQAANVQQLKALRGDLAEYIKSKHCNPIVVRLAWHDSGTYDKGVEGWPNHGGANASIRFKPEASHKANTGLEIARELLEGFKDKYPEVSYADLYQMASATAIEVIRYGRVDADDPKQCAQEGNLPEAAAPFGHKGTDAASHLRAVFYRMGFSDQEIVALSGGHTLGRARPDRGYPPAKAVTKYTKDGPGTPGGQSWTPDWLTFNNSYFTELKARQDEELLVLPTDAAVFEDEKFKPWAEKYAANQSDFFEDYAKAHARLSELGVKWDIDAPVTI